MANVHDLKNMRQKFRNLVEKCKDERVSTDAHFKKLNLELNYCSSCLISERLVNTVLRDENPSTKVVNDFTCNSSSSCALSKTSSKNDFVLQAGPMNKFLPKDKEASIAHR